MLTKKERKNKFINVKLFLPEEKSLYVIALYLTETLSSSLKNLRLKEKIRLKKEYYCYLKRENKILKKLNEDTKIEDLKLQENDEILISYVNLKIPKNNEIIPDSKENWEIEIKKKKIEKKKQEIELTEKIVPENPIEIYNEKPKKVIIENGYPTTHRSKILFFIFLFILFASLIFVIYKIVKFYKKKKIIIDHRSYRKDDLVIVKKYPINMLLRYSNKKETEIQLEGEKVEKQNSNQSLGMSSDFIFIVRDETIEKDELKLTENILYTGYIAFLNLTSYNKTYDWTIVYDKNLNEFLNNSKLNNLDLKYINEEGNFCFVKIEFYQNGNIKNYYIPRGMPDTSFTFIEDISKLIIPKISSNLYIKSIDEYLKDLSKNEGENNISEYEGRRILNSYNKDKNKIYKKRKLDASSYNMSFDKDDDNDIIIEEYNTKPLIPSFDYDVREANQINSEDDDGNKNGNYSNLTQFSLRNAECQDAKMEGSTVNSTIYSIINDKGILEFVEEKEVSIMKTQNQGSNENDLETESLFSSVYDSNNQISFSDNEENNKDMNNQNIDFGITSLNTINSHKINLSDYFINEEINKKLYDYFDNFTYDLYNENNNDKESNNLEEEKQININNNRRLAEENTYYGMKKITQVRQLYKYNLIGLRMEKQIFIENDPSTGTVSIYYITIFGNKNTKIKTGEQHSNLHIIIDRKNQMGYKLITLLNQSNYDLVQRNKKYSDIIIQLEKNMSNLVEEYFDFSNLFNEAVKNLYEQVKNFSSEFFKELIKLINQAYYNYTFILNNSKKGNYEVMNKIRKVIEEEYTNYIYDMLSNLEIFQNNTLLFLDDVEKELEKIDDFQIDALYDLIDQIYNAKLIFQSFNKNLFKAIEKGITVFKYDINDYIENVIGDLLYLTDFLYININKNDILIKAIDENERKDVTIKLQNFRNIVIDIMDSLILNINKDYEEKMSINNKNSIKNFSYEKVDKLAYNILSKSDNTILNIKKKIYNIDLYELYVNNIDIINDINNKTIFEYINNMYNIINSSLNFKPEYLDNNSEILKNRKSLSNISNNIVSQINKEINDINKYISNYTKNYLDENLYRIHYNLYYLKKNFDNNKMNDLLKEFYSMIETTLSSYFKNMMINNFELCFTVLNEAISMNKYNYRSCTHICSKFYERLQEYKAKYRRFFNLLYSDFLNMAEKYFYELRNDIVDYVQNKILSINKYYFNTELYNNKFYLIDISNKEALNVIDNINNYFNELNLNNELKVNALNLIDKILDPIQNKNMDKIDELYQNLYNNIKKDEPQIKECDNDLMYRWWRMPVFGTASENKDCPHRNNLYYVKTDLRDVNTYLKDKKTIILKNFIKKIEDYINKYHLYCQNLYNQLYQYAENKINNDGGVDKLLMDYQKVFNIVIANDTNEGLLERLNNEKNNIENNFNSYIGEFENNIKYIENTYFNLKYLEDMKKFLEYPNEIIYKINQFNNELLENSYNINNTINSLYKNKINNIIKSTNYYITDYTLFNFKYIISNINGKDIFNEYYLSIYNKIKKLFDIDFDTINNNSYIYYSNYSNDTYNDSFSLFNLENYQTIINNYSDFAMYLEQLTNEKFIPLKVENYSEYNYNIIKLRTGLYYTKTLLENIENLFEEINFIEIINADKINYNDKMLNNKNILDIYNETNYKYDEINKEIISNIEESFEYFISNLKLKYSYDNDYTPFIQKFKEIITYKNEDYNNNIIYKNNETINNIMLLLNQINDTLLSQLSLTKKYDFYNINETYFKDIYIYYYSLIKIMFDEYKNATIYLNDSHSFHNSIKNILQKLQNKKREYFKKIINNLSKNYNFNLFDLYYDLGENVNLFMEKEYYDYEFQNIYKYVELFENYTFSFKNGIILNINNTEKVILDKYNDIYNNFLNRYKNNISNFIINEQHIKELNNKFLICLDYSYDILKEKKDMDIIYNKKYNNIINIINLTYLNCSYNENNKIPNEDISFNAKIEYIKNNNNKCINDLYNNSNKEDDIFILLNCYKNNFYNYSSFYFNEFNNTYKNKLDDAFDAIRDKIKNNFIDEKFIINFMEEQNYQLPSYENISISDLSYSFEEIESMIEYYNNIKSSEYKNYLVNLLIKSFNFSYYNFINNFILDELNEDVEIRINTKLRLQFEYMYEKIKNEYNYYLIILNKTKEIGYSSKIAFINLYKDIKKKLNESFNYYFIEEIDYYLNLFYRDNKKIFKNNFLNYYVGNLNEYTQNLNINKIKEYINEIVLDKNFNKTLEKITEDLINNIIIESIKKNINNSVNSKVLNLYNIFDELKNNISDVLENIHIKELPEDMTFLNQLILNYLVLVENQNNYFILKISDKPFKYLNNFISEHLEPPLLLIKDKYNIIEENLLNEIIKIINTFPDYFSIIKNSLKLEKINDNITLMNGLIDELLFEYKNILDEDIKSYINKLIHYTYINGLNYFKNPCNESYCLFKFNKTNTTKLRNNEEKKQYRYFSHTKKNESEIKKLINRKIRHLKEYDYTMGAISENDIINSLYKLKESLCNFNKSYLSAEYKNIKNSFKRFMNNINDTYLIKLKRSINMVALKFSTILTENSYKELENSIFEQYYNIELYINNASNIIELSKIQFTDKLDNSSLLIDSINNITSKKVLKYYNLFNKLIQKKLKNINEEEINKNRKLEFNIIYNSAIDEAFSAIEEGIEEEESEDQNEEDEEDENKIILYDKSKDLTISYEFIFPFSLFPGVSLIIVIEPKIILKIGILLELENNPLNNEFSLSLDGYGKVSVYIKLEIGIEIPAIEVKEIDDLVPIPKIFLTLGLDGLICSVKTGLKLTLFLKKSEFEVDLYLEIKAFEFSFYCLFRFELKIKFINFHFSFEFYLFNMAIGSLSFDIHKKRTYRYLK